jgi:hypothetical protein
LRRLERKHGNLVAMMSWLVDQDRLDTTVHLVWATWRFWYLQGHADDLARFMTNVLAKARVWPRTSTRWRWLPAASRASPTDTRGAVLL